MYAEELGADKLFMAALKIAGSDLRKRKAEPSLDRSRVTTLSYVLADESGAVIRRIPIDEVKQVALRMRGFSPANSNATPEALAGNTDEAPPRGRPETTNAEPNEPGVILQMKGRKSYIKAFEDRVELSPFGLFGFMSQGLAGTKAIPYESIIAIQFKPVSHLTVGFIQFTLPGAIEKGQGVFNAVNDENTFTFGDNGELALEIKNYIDSRIATLRRASSRTQPAGSGDIGEELHKLSVLLEKGLLSQQEFDEAKRRILSP